MTDRYDDIINLPHPTLKKTSQDVNDKSGSSVLAVCSIDRI